MDTKENSGKVWEKLADKQTPTAHYPKYKLRRAPTGSGNGALIKQY